MKLSVWSSYYLELSPEDSVLEFIRHGYNYSELSDEHALVLMNRGDPKETGRKFKDFAEAHNFSFLQGHLILQAKLCEKEDREILKKQLDLFGAIGIKNAVLHCDSMFEHPDLTHDEKQRRNIDALTDLTDYIADTDIVICIENMRDKHITITAEDLLYYVNKINSTNLGICLDTGHLNLYKINSHSDFIKKAGKHIKALHITDNNGEADWHIMPYGKGNIDFITVVSALKSIEYDGLYNLEIPGEKNAPLEIKGYKLEYIKKMFECIDRNTSQKKP